MGAWIETARNEQGYEVGGVAPHVGAWIETRKHPAQRRSDESRPTWARGLKHPCDKVIYLQGVSRPTWARGLKLQFLVIFGKGLRRAPRGRVD